MKRTTLGIICCFVCLVLLGLILFAVLGLVQRDVGMHVINTSVQKNEASLGPDGIQVPIKVDMLGYNDNFFGIALDDLDLTGTTPLYDATLVHGHIDHLYLGSRSEVPFNVTLIMTYSAKHDEGSKFIQTIASTCVNKAATAFTINIHAQGKYSMYLRKNHDFNLDQQQAIPCSSFTGLL
jgi:hypothetical protein